MKFLIVRLVKCILKSKKPRKDNMNLILNEILCQKFNYTIAN